MNKPNLFLDFDGLKFDTLPLHVSYINERYGIESQLQDYIDANYSITAVVKKYLPERKDLTRENIYEDLGTNFIASLDWHKNAEPIDGMCEIVKLLAEKYTLYTVTARQKTGRKVIQYLLDKFIPNCISDIHCVWEYMGNGLFQEVSKKDFILSVAGEKIAFIDDSPEEILKMQDVIPSYLFDSEGTYEKRNDINHRVRSWKHIGEVFL